MQGREQEQRRHEVLRLKRVAEEGHEAGNRTLVRGPQRVVEHRQVEGVGAEGEEIEEQERGVHGQPECDWQVGQDA